MFWWGFFHHVASWNYLNLFPWQFHAASRPRIMKLVCRMLVPAGLRETVCKDKQSIGALGMEFDERALPLGKSQRWQRKTHSNTLLIVVKPRYFYFVSHELKTFVQPVLQVFGNLLRSSKWVTCSPFHLICNLILVSTSAVDLAKDFLKLFLYSLHGSDRTCSLMTRFGSFLKVFHCPILFSVDWLH